MSSAVIVDVVRSPLGKGKASGSLAPVHPVDLLAGTLAGLLGRNGIDPGTVDDVLVGCVNQNLEQAGSIGRQAWLAAGYPVHVPATSIERKCGSGQQAVDFATFGVLAGAYDIVVAAGTESMSRVPMGSNRGGADVYGPAVNARFPDLVSQGVAAELVADKYAITREELDVFSVRSHALAAAARDSGGFDREIIPVARPDGSVVSADETIRAGSSVEALAALQSAFGSADMVARYPHIDWRVTAGNSSQITDGSAAALIMSEEQAAALGLRPRARIVATTVVGEDPVMMLTGPIRATHRVLAKAGLDATQMDAIEINEAFASVPLAWHREFPEVDPARVNPRGGAIALGHPLGASGVRLLTSLISELEATGGRYGLQTMCEAGGMANAYIVERLG